MQALRIARIFSAGMREYRVVAMPTKCRKFTFKSSSPSFCSSEVRVPDGHGELPETPPVNIRPFVSRRICLTHLADSGAAPWSCVHDKDLSWTVGTVCIEHTGPTLASFDRRRRCSRLTDLVITIAHYADAYKASKDPPCRRIILPACHRLPVDRLANLRDAGRANGTLILVKFDTGRFPVQSASCYHSPCHRLQIVDRLS